MVAWANGGYGGLVNFIMLCMETGKAGLQTARSFGQQFEVPTTVMNGYIDKQSELPKFGQLGCGGFIVLGPYGEFIAPRTAPAYMRKGPMAFAVVERILGSLGIQPAPATLPAESKCNNTPVHLTMGAVGNKQMDEEHQGLVAVVADLIQQRSVGSLRRLRELWAEHSHHEEALFEQYNFGGARGGELSGTASHCQHHRAILDIMDLALQSADTTGDCCTPGVMGKQVVQEIVAEVQRHGDVYDSAYAGKLA